MKYVFPDLDWSEIFEGEIHRGEQIDLYNVFPELSDYRVVTVETILIKRSLDGEIYKEVYFR